MKISKTIKKLHIFLMLSGICLFAAQSLWAVDFISATSAHDNAAAGIGVVIDVRSVEEHNGCDISTNGAFVGCPTVEIENRGAPAWTDTASGVQMQSINIPYWINSTASDTLPQDTTEFGNSFQALLDAGYITTSTPVYLLCRSGYRSYYGGVYIEGNGLNFTNVYSVDGAGVAAGGSGTGGMLEWYAANLPIPWNTDFSTIDRGYKAPQVLSITPTTGNISTTSSVDFTVGILEPTWGDTGGVMYYTTIERFSLYIDGVETEFTTSDPTSGALWTTYTFTTTLADGDHTWDIRAESQNRSDETNDASNLISWNPNADAIGAGNRTITVSTVTLEANISVSPASLDFGSVTVGNTSSPQTITVTSDGTADLDITTITATGDFGIQNDTCSNQTIATGSTCTLDVVFSPSAEGTLTGSVSIPSNDPDTPTATVSLSGSGTAVLEANISVSSASLDFGSVLVGDTSAPQAITVTSNGTADLVITTITVTGDYSIQNDTCSSQTIVSGSNCTLDVVFSPSAEGTLTGSVSIPSNDPDTPTATVSLSGSGTATPEANISVSSASLDFGSVLVGDTSAPQAITVTSNGTADLVITTITVTGDFGIQNDTCSSQTIATGSTCTLDVVFSPSAEGTLTGSVSIPSNDPDTPTATVSLSGSGTVTLETIGFISAISAHDNAAAGTGVIIDMRTVEEHNGCNASWGGVFDTCPNTEAENRGAPAWTDTTSGVQMQSINIPFWINSTTSDTLPQDATEFENSFQALLDSGYITTSTPVYLLCRSGYRSYYGGVWLQDNMGFTNVYSIDGAGVSAGGSGTGGMLEWYAAGLPIPWNTDYSTIDRGYKGPQVLSITPTTGNTSTTSSVDFTVGVLEPTWGDTGGTLYYTTIERFSLYIDGVETEFTTSDPTSGALWTTYTFTTTLANGTYTWDVRAESQNRSDEATDASNLISWNPNADAIGAGNRTITVSTATLEANISVSSASLDFGSVVVGNTSAPQTITVTSDGTADLDIGTITVTGDFSIQNDLCSSQTIASGSNCTLDVVFSPSAEGALTGSISIPSNDPDGDATVLLSGSGTTESDAVLPAVGNTGGPELVSPADGSTVNSSLTLEWMPFADAVSYEVYYCKNQDFSGTDIGCSGAEPIVVTSLGRNGVYFYAGSGLAFILLGLMVLGGIRQRGKLMLFVIAVMISSTMFIVSCQSVGDEDDTLYKRGNRPPAPEEPNTKTYDVSGLEAGQTYYWGVVAVDANGVKTASTAWSFTVN